MNKTSVVCDCSNTRTCDFLPPARMYHINNTTHRFESKLHSSSGECGLLSKRRVVCCVFSDDLKTEIHINDGSVSSRLCVSVCVCERVWCV